MFNDENTDRGLQYLSEPPRKVPLSLKLFLLFTNQTSGGLFLLDFMLPFIYISVDKAPGFMWKAITGLFVVVGIWLSGYGLATGLKRINLLTNGRMTYAVLLSKNRKVEKDSDSRTTVVDILTFEYSAAGQKHQLVYEARNESTKLLEDEQREPVIYSDEAPGKGLLLDSMHAKINMNENGSFVLKTPVKGYIYLLVDMLFLAVFIIGILWIYGKIKLFN
ncbi:MAG: hypothetical protein A2231_12595 [Candidatus Firestonebacteria bacterium RIFOXYA2_FULL_40_8]|nr:MAG: hypothetical protein A2231_12595 [Candidatus Firestonebacteria bacterium RIFOXYA2_FULL_40_8]